MAKDKDKDEYSPVGFGGKSEGGNARDVFERHYSEDAWKDKHLGPNWQHRYRGKDGTELGNGEFAERDHKRFEADRAWAAASGSWVAKSNEHAKKLYEEDGLDYNDMRKYAAEAGIGDINSEKDVQGIRDHIESRYTSQEQLEAYVNDILGKQKKEEGTNEPVAENEPIEHSSEVAAAIQRTSERGTNGNSDSYFNKIDDDVVKDAAASKDGTDDAKQEANAFLDNYKLDLSGVMKPSKPVEKPVTANLTV